MTSGQGGLGNYNQDAAPSVGDLDLIVALADQAAQGAIRTYTAEEWRRSPLRQILDAATGRMVSASRPIPASVVEALDKLEAARTPLT